MMPPEYPDLVQDCYIAEFVLVRLKFVHYQFTNSSPENYDTDINEALHARKKQRSSGTMRLNGPFEIRWGDAASSAKMGSSPSGMMQVNLTNNNTRVVKQLMDVFHTSICIVQEGTQETVIRVMHVPPFKVSNIKTPFFRGLKTWPCEKYLKILKQTS